MHALRSSDATLAAHRASNSGALPFSLRCARMFHIGRTSHETFADEFAETSHRSFFTGPLSQVSLTGVFTGFLSQGRITGPLSQVLSRSSIGTDTLTYVMFYTSSLTGLLSQVSFTGTLS